MIESITGNGYKLEIEYGLENQRISQSLSSVNQYGQTTLLLNKHFIGGLQEKIFYETGAEKTISYISSPEGLTAIEVKSGASSEWYTVFTDHLGSITTLIRESDGSRFELSYDALGNRRDPATWVNYSGNLPDFITITDSDFITDRGFTGHEHLAMFGLINMNGRVYDPVASRFLSPDSYVQSPELALNYNGYVYCLNNPLKYTDPDGEFFTWNFSNGGFSIGFNLTPIGIPLGAGINIGWGDGASYGRYVEVGYRVGGTGFGSGAFISQSIDYNFKHNGWTATTTESAYLSYGWFNASANISQTYDLAKKQWSNSWGISAGVGFGNDEKGIGFNVGYGSSGWSYGLGGYYNSRAWEDNPTYEPEQWNDNADTQLNNNCYSYALDDPDNPFGGKPQPGQYSGEIFENLTLDDITAAAIRDGRIKQPAFWNKLGFGKQGYYEVYLVLDNTDGIQDYHWYRQDKGGLWSQKHGNGLVTNVDGAGRLIHNPARANHFYVNYGGYGTLNYNAGGTFLWVRRR